jgi:hypothetical protein
MIGPAATKPVWRREVYRFCNRCFNAAVCSEQKHIRPQETPRRREVISFQYTAQTVTDKRKASMNGRRDRRLSSVI